MEQKSIKQVSLCVKQALAELNIHSGKLLVTDGLMENGVIKELSEKFNLEYLDSAHSLKSINSIDCSAVVAVDISMQGEDLGIIHGYCLEHSLPLVICCNNYGGIENLYSIITGKTETMSGVTLGQLQQCMDLNGFKEETTADWLYDMGMEGNLAGDSRHSFAFEYLKWLAGSFSNAEDTRMFVRGYIAKSLPNKPAESLEENSTPFLSIVTRTQGKRITELRDVFLCLAAQTDMDFEVVLVAHKAGEQEISNLENLIAEFPAYLRDRINLYLLDAGNRAAPLNFGFGKASGQYITILDDDDLVTSDWAEVFHKNALLKPGRIIHSYNVTQDWRKGTLQDALCSVARVSAEYCVPFDYPRQFHINKCPSMSLAYPRWLYHDSSIRFDEELDTNEDWDFLMRCSLLAGVQDVPEVTSVYRLWEGVGSSHVLHSIDEWADTEKEIKIKWSKYPVAMEPGSSLNLAEYFRISYFAKENLLVPGHRAMLMAGTGDGIFSGKPMFASNMADLPGFYFTYYLGTYQENVTMLRFDPADMQNIAVCNLEISITAADGEQINFSITDCRSNGYNTSEGLVFLKADPQIYIPLPCGVTAKAVTIRGSVFSPVPEGMINLLLPDLQSQGVLFGDDGTGINEHTTYRNTNKGTGDSFAYSYAVESIHLKTGVLRFDPVDTGNKGIKDFKAVFYLADGETVEFSAAECTSNGKTNGNMFVFTGDDPQIYIPVPDGFAGGLLEVSGKVCDAVLDIESIIFSSFGKQAGAEGENQENTYSLRAKFDMPVSGEIRVELPQPGSFYITDFSAEVADPEGGTYKIDNKSLQAAGANCDEGFAFYEPCPCIFIPLPEGVCAESCILSFNAQVPAPQWVHESILQESKNIRPVLYLDSGNGWNETETLHSPYVFCEQEFCIEYAVPHGPDAQIIALRWDPDEKPGFEIEQLCVRFTLNNGEQHICAPESFKGNYIMQEGRLIFLIQDPQIYFNLAGKTDVCKVTITGKYSDYVSAESVAELSKPSFMNRLLSKAGRFFKK